MKFWAPIDKWLVPLVFVAILNGVAIVREQPYLLIFCTLIGGFLYYKVSDHSEQKP